MRRALPVVSLAALAVTGCVASRPTSSAGGTVVAVATINAWGSILAQLGGTHVHATSIITNPATDPHDYEPTVEDARTIADAALVVENGIGYDSWAQKVLAANPASAREVVDVGHVTGIGSGGNPHRWYSPTDVGHVADTITADLVRLDPADAAYFRAQRAAFDSTALARYHALIADIRARYAGTPVGASESIVSPLADALGLTVLTPATFLRAISEGTDPSPADTAAIDRQISEKQIKVYVLNSQNSTPDVAAQVSAARAKGIPVASVTETLSPASATFEDWQVAQLEALAAALHQATGR